MSDKALVKHLQRELARLESELRSPIPTPTTSYNASLLREKDRQIEKMEKEIKELTRQRDLAQSRLEDLLNAVGGDNSSKHVHVFNQLPKSHLVNISEDDNSNSELSGHDFCHSWENSRGTTEDLEDPCKEVRCIEMEESRTKNGVEGNASLPAEGEGILSRNVDATDTESLEAPRGGDDSMLSHADSTYGALERKLQDVQKTIDCLVSPYPEAPSPSHTASDLSRSRIQFSRRSRSSRETLMTSTPPSFEKIVQDVNTPLNGFEKEFPGRPNGLNKKPFALNFGANTENLPAEDSHLSRESSSVDELTGVDAKISTDEDITSISTFVTGLKEMAKLQYEKQLVSQGQETGESGKCSKDVGLDPMNDILDSPLSWSLEFQRQRREIIELWQTCNVSLVHRTYFFLLFNGDPNDNIYMEVELRRLSFLKETFSQGHPDRVAVENGLAVTPVSSMRALRREREMLSKRMQKRLSVKERESLYQKWGIGLDTKQRRLQLVQCLWTAIDDMEHVMESAAIIAKLVGMLKPGQALKEMFGLSFTPTSQRSYSWRYSLSSFISRT